MSNSLSSHSNDHRKNIRLVSGKARSGQSIHKGVKQPQQVHDPGTHPAPHKNMAAEFIDFLPTACLLLNEFGLINAANEAAAAMFAIPQAHILGKPIITRISPGGQAKFYQALRHLLKNTSTREVLSIRIRTRTNEELTLEFDMRLIPQENNDLQILATMRNLSIESKLQSEIMQQKQTIAVLSERLHNLQVETNNAIQAKNEFVAHITHELRTPMQSAYAAAELLQQAELSPELMELANIIAVSARHMKDTADASLNYSKIEMGQASICCRPFKVKVLIEEVIAQFRLEAARKSIELSFSVDENVCGTINSDPLKLRQVLVNLVSNALKFVTQGHVHIRVSTFGRQQKLLFTVSDSGPGMNSDALNELFKPFSCKQNLESQLHGGTGLGLFICKSIVETLGGNIAVESVQGHGSKILFSLPYSVASDSVVTVNPPKQDGSQRPSLRVLIAEDNDTTAKVISILLTRLGCTVHRASDGQQALEILSNREIDLIFMDEQMPKLSGSAATEAIRQLSDPVKSQTPVIGLTGNSSPEERQRFLDCGMNNVLIKPASLESFQETIAMYSHLATQSQSG